MVLQTGCDRDGLSNRPAICAAPYLAASKIESHLEDCDQPAHWPAVLVDVSDFCLLDPTGQ